MLNSSSYGLVGDGVTNDYAAFQTFLNALSNTGGVGVLEPKHYYISDGDLSLQLAPGIRGCRLIANGASIITNPAQYRSGLVIVNQTALTRQDETRKVIVEGLHIDHFENPMATFGIRVDGSTHVVLRDCQINSGADNAAKQNYMNYEAITFRQGVSNNGDTGCFWGRIQNCTIKGAIYPMPMGILVYGQDNALEISSCDLANVTNGIMLQVDDGGNIANGTRVFSNDFEGVTNCFTFFGGVSNYTTMHGLMFHTNRVEACGTMFNYILDKNPSANSPIIRGNMVISTPSTIYNPHNLTVVQ